MCKKVNSKKSNTHIDRCIRPLINWLKKDTMNIPVASCCGHGKYPITVVVKNFIGYSDSDFEMEGDDMKLLELSAYVIGIVIGIYLFFSGKIVESPFKEWGGIIKLIRSGNYTLNWAVLVAMLVAAGLTIGIYLLLNRKKTGVES